MLDLVIRGGDVVTPQGVGRWDVAVQGERIVAVGLPDPETPAGRVLDATGKIVVPGGVEPHTHLAHFISMHPEDNLHTLGPEEDTRGMRSEEHTSELQSPCNLVCRLLLETKT